MTKYLCVIDDDPVISLLVKDAVTSHGFTVISVTSGDEAVRRLTKESRVIDLILLDMNMPGLNGIETCQLLREMLPETPILMMTEEDRPDIIERAYTSGITDYITKPIKWAFLIDQVNYMLTED